MLSLPKKERSLLKPDGFRPVYPKLNKDIAIDTVVVGGGIVGLSTAYLLAKAGQKVAVLEKDAIGSGTTGHTTGKVTSQHNLVYAQLSDRLGKKTARIYGEANQTAVEQIQKIIKEEKVDCGWEKADNYVYTTNPSRISEFKREAKVAAGLGLPASFETTSPLPFEIKAAVRFRGQGHFSGQKYIEALAKIIQSSGSYVFERTQASGFKDGRPCLITAGNHQLSAKSVVIATNVPTWPLAARGTYCLLEYPTTSYLVAGKPRVKIKGMYISPDKENYSILPVGDTLLVGGENHIPGLGFARNRQQKLASFAEWHFGVKKIDYRWHARDYLAYDGVPLIGKLYPWSKNMYVATAFKKWGLSHSLVAAMILRDRILGQPNPWAATYDSTRTSPIKSIPRAIFS